MSSVLLSLKRLIHRVAGTLQTWLSATLRVVSIVITWQHATRTRCFAWLALAVVAAFWLRQGPSVVLYLDDRVWFDDPDACFHMRRVFLLLAHGGSLPELDRWSNFPEGVVPYVAPLLDWIVYAVCRLCGLGAGDEAAVGRVAAYLPPVLGALTVLPTWGIARRLWPAPAAATAAALVLAVLPGHVLYTRYAMVDHHVLEAFLLTFLVWCILARGRTARHEWALASATALCLLGLSLAWNGFALYVILLSGISVLGPWRRPDGAAARGPMQAVRILTVYFPLLAVFVMGGPWYREGQVRYDAPSSFHLALTAICGLWCAAMAKVYRRATFAGPATPGEILYWWDRHAWRRVGAALGIGGLLAALCVAAPGPWGNAFISMFGFPDIYVNRVNLEGRPVWEYTQWIFDHLSGITFLMPLAVYALCAMAEEQGIDTESVWHLCGWALALFILTLWMTRFTYAYAPFLAVVISGIAWAGARAGASLLGWLAHPVAQAAVGAAIAIGALTPCLQSTQSIYQGDMDSGPGRARALLALRERTRDPGDWLRPEEKPAYGILAPWYYGHGLKFWSRRPTVSDNMGVGFDKEFRFLFSTDEQEAYRTLRNLGVGYVLVAHDSHLIQEYVELSLGPGRGPVFATRKEKGADWKATDLYWTRIAIRLMSGDGAGGEGGLAHFRFVADSASAAEKDKQASVDFKVFEVVAGARLTGLFAAGETVSARITVKFEGGRTFAWERKAVCDEAGRFEIVVPYATGGAGTTVGYTVGTAARFATVEVSEGEVREGKAIEVRIGE